MSGVNHYQLAGPADDIVEKVITRLLLIQVNGGFRSANDSVVGEKIASGVSNDAKPVRPEDEVPEYSMSPISLGVNADRARMHDPG